MIYVQLLEDRLSGLALMYDTDLNMEKLKTTFSESPRVSYIKTVFNGSLSFSWKLYIQHPLFYTLHALMHAYNAHFGASCIHNNELPQFGINCYFCRHTLIFFIALQCDKIKGFHDFISIQSRASPQTPIGELTALTHTRAMAPLTPSPNAPTHLTGNPPVQFLAIPLVLNLCDSRHCFGQVASRSVHAGDRGGDYIIHAKRACSLICSTVSQ